MYAADQKWIGFFFLGIKNKSSISLDMSKNSSEAGFSSAFMIHWQFQMYLKNP